MGDWADQCLSWVKFVREYHYLAEFEYEKILKILVVFEAVEIWENLMESDGKKGNIFMKYHIFCHNFLHCVQINELYPL